MATDPTLTLTQSLILTRSGAGIAEREGRMELRGRSIPRRGSGDSSPFTSPLRRKRLQEKEDLQQLNDRLATCVEQSFSHDSEQQEQLRQLQESKEEDSARCRSVRRRLECELDDRGRQLEAKSTERDRLEVELSRVLEEKRRLEERNAKNESKLKSALAQLKDKESALRSNQAQLATSLSEKKKMESELDEVKDELAKTHSVVHDFKTKLQDEKSQNVNLVIKIERLQEELDYQKSFQYREWRDTKICEKIRKQIEQCHQEAIQNRTEEILKLREDQSEQIKEYKDQVEKTLNLKLKNALLEGEKNRDFALTAKQELEEAELKSDRLSSELQQSQCQVSELKVKLHDSEMMLDHKQAAWHQKMVAKDEQIEKMSRKAQEKMEYYEQLLDMKLALDFEINAYNKLLEEEEKRLDLTPCSLPRSGAFTTSSATSSRGTKRKLFVADIDRYDNETRECGYFKGKVSIEDICNKGKYIKLRNVSNEDQPLNGWMIKRINEDLAEITFRFPEHFTLKAKQTVTIWAGSRDEVSGSPPDLVWNDWRLCGTGDVKVVLLNPDRMEMSTRTVEQIPVTQQGTPGEEEYEDPTVSRRRPQFRSTNHDGSEDSRCLVM